MREEFSLKELRQFENVSKNLFMGTVILLHKTGLLDSAIERLAAPALMNFAASKLKSESDPDGQKRIREIFTRAAHQFLPVVEKDPHVSLFDGMTLENMRPRSHDAKPPKQTVTGETVAVINVFGCFIDGRATYGTTFADTGHTYALDWTKVREFLKKELGMPDKSLSGNDLVLNHFETYGGLHPDTLRQVRYYYANKGTLSDEDTEKYSRPPRLQEMPIIRMSTRGVEDVQTPDGRPLVRVAQPEAHELIRPDHILHELEKIDHLSATNLRERMNASPAINSLFEPRKKPSQDPSPRLIPVYLFPKAPQNYLVQSGGLQNREPA